MLFLALAPALQAGKVWSSVEMHYFIFLSMDSEKEDVRDLDSFQYITLAGAWNPGTLISEFLEKSFNFFVSFYHDDNNHSHPLNKHLLNVHCVPDTLLGHSCTFNLF